LAQKVESPEAVIWAPRAPFVVCILPQGSIQPNFAQVSIDRDGQG